MIRYRVVVADPPWPFNDKLKMSKVKRGAEANYALMSMQDIYDMGKLVEAVCEPDAVLVMWVPASLLQEGLNAMTAWGFRQTQVYDWVKTTKRYKPGLRFKFRPVPLAFGMGRLFRGANEIALVGVRGSPYKYLLNKSQRNVSLAVNAGHSIKPDNLQVSLDLMFSGPKLELFGRRKLPGWTVLGNQITGNDIRIDLARLGASDEDCYVYPSDS